MDSTMTRKGKEKNLYKDKTKYGQKRVRQVEKLLEKLFQNFWILHKNQYNFLGYL